MELQIDSQIGSMKEDIDINKMGKDIMIGFNPKFLIDALKVIDDEEIHIYLMNPKAPCFIRDDAGQYVYLILPVNFNLSEDNRKHRKTPKCINAERTKHGNYKIKR